MCHLLHLTAWEHALAHHPDWRFISFIVKGIKHGFRIGFNSGVSLVSASSNMSSAAEQIAVVSKYVEGELTPKRFVSPYTPESCPNFHISHTGAVPKGHTPGKWRIIMNLLFPARGSVNEVIDLVFCTLSYVTVDEMASLPASNVRSQFYPS